MREEHRCDEGHELAAAGQPHAQVPVRNVARHQQGPLQEAFRVLEAARQRIYSSGNPDRRALRVPALLLARWQSTHAVASTAHPLFHPALPRLGVVQPRAGHAGERVASQGAHRNISSSSST